MENKIEIYFDANLRDVAKDQVALISYLETLEKDLESDLAPVEQIKILGELGVYYRILHNYQIAEKCLLQALRIIKLNNLGVKYETQQNIRLAHVHQWKKDFIKSNEQFEQIINLCKMNKDASIYLDFAYQHAGKNFLEQGQITEALSMFEEALKIRLEKKSPIDQLESTQLAIKKCNDLLKLNKIKLFKEIIIGGVTKEELLQQLLKAGIHFNEYGNKLINHPSFTPPQNKENVKLVKVSLAEIGLEETCTWDEFEVRASIFKMKLCPLYLGAFLRLEYLDQLNGPYLTIASKKLSDDNEMPNGFYLRNFENLLWLRGYRADGFDGWPGTNEFVFIINENNL